MPLYALDDKTPIVPEEGAWWAAPNSQIIGHVIIGEQVSIWFGAVIRGDNEPITIGAYSNVQDNSVLHTDAGFPLEIGKNVTIGHRVCLHGCFVDDNALIGIGAVVLNGARIGKNCIIGAQSFVKEGMEIPDNSLVVGVPGKIIGEVNAETRAMIQAAADEYIHNGPRFAKGLRQL